MAVAGSEEPPWVSAPVMVALVAVAAEARVKLAPLMAPVTGMLAVQVPLVNCSVPVSENRALAGGEVCETVSVAVPVLVEGEAAVTVPV